MKKKELFKEYEKVKGTCDCIVLMIHMPHGETETITNPNVEEKLEYIDKTYSDDLVHSNCKEIYIEDYIFCLKTDTYDFGTALAFLKDGLKVARKGWNGKNQYLVYIDPYNNEQFKLVEEQPLGTFYPYIAIKTNYNAIVPWLASQTDMLTEDWVVVE